MKAFFHFLVIGQFGRSFSSFRSTWNAWSICCFTALLLAAPMQADAQSRLWAGENYAEDSSRATLESTSDSIIEFVDPLLVMPKFLPHEDPALEVSMDLQPDRFQYDHTRLFIILLCLALLLGILRMYFVRELENIFTALANIKLAQQAYRDREFGQGPGFLLLFALFLGSLGLFIRLAAPTLGLNHPMGTDYSSLLWPVIVVLLFFWLRYASRRFVGWLFQLEEEFGFFNYNVSLLNGLAGILLLPLLFFMGLGAKIVALFATYLALFVLVILVALRTVRGFQIGARIRGLDNMHFILYICTLEIAPIIIVYKLVSDWMVIS